MRLGCSSDALWLQYAAQLLQIEFLPGCSLLCCCWFNGPFSTAPTIASMLPLLLLPLLVASLGCPRLMSLSANRRINVSLLVGGNFSSIGRIRLCVCATGMEASGLTERDGIRKSQRSTRFAEWMMSNWTIFLDSPSLPHRHLRSETQY